MVAASADLAAGADSVGEAGASMAEVEASMAEAFMAEVAGADTDVSGLACLL